MSRLVRLLVSLGLLALGVVVLQDFLRDPSWLDIYFPSSSEYPVASGHLPHSEPVERWVCVGIGVGAVLAGIGLYVRPTLGRMLGVFATFLGIITTARQVVTTWQTATGAVTSPGLFFINRLQFVWSTAGGMVVLLIWCVLLLTCLLMHTRSSRL